MSHDALQNYSFLISILHLAAFLKACNTSDDRYLETQETHSICK
jgi:hypothetical protein